LSFVRHIELQNFLNTPRISTTVQRWLLVTMAPGKCERSNIV